MRKVEIFTDGSCLGNPGAGGWAAILRCDGIEKEISGGEGLTTNNRMELTAVIRAFGALKYPCAVDLYSDSRYVLDGIEKGWARKWKANGWMRNKREKALNADLWEKLLQALEPHQVTYHWVKGHDGHPENERCDSMAVAQSKQFEQQKGFLGD